MTRYNKLQHRIIIIMTRIESGNDGWLAKECVPEWEESGGKGRVSWRLAFPSVNTTAKTGSQWYLCEGERERERENMKCITLLSTHRNERFPGSKRATIFAPTAAPLELPSVSGLLTSACRFSLKRRAPSVTCFIEQHIFSVIHDLTKYTLSFKFPNVWKTILLGKKHNITVDQRNWRNSEETGINHRRLIRLQDAKLLSITAWLGGFECRGHSDVDEHRLGGLFVGKKWVE